MSEQPQVSISNLNMNGEEVVSNPYPFYDQLRRQDPVHWSESDNYWYITRYADLTSVIRDDRISSARFSALAASLPEDTQQSLADFIGGVSSWMLLSDPPSHSRMRGLVNKAFTPRMIDNLKNRIQTLVDEMLEGVQGKGRMDIMADLAIPLPGVVISDMLGVPEEDRPQFKKWSDDIAVGLTGSDSTGTQAQRFAIGQKSFSELSDYFRGVVEGLRGHPQDNLLSAMVEAEEAGDKLTQEE